MIWYLMGLSGILILGTGGWLISREIRHILNSVKIVEYDPVLIGENYRCPTCSAFWYMKDEEVHFKGCVVPIIKRVRK